MTLTQQLAITHTRAKVLRMIAADALSEFETALIDEIAQRRAAFGDDAKVTAAEAERLAEALTAMETHLRRTFSENAEAIAQVLDRVEPAVGGLR